MSLKAFLSQNAQLPQNEKIIISNRFTENGEPVPFEIKAVTEEVNSKIRTKATKINIGKKGKTSDFDSSQYLSELIVASVVEPDLQNAELQASYGVIGATKLLEVMLLPGEYGDLLNAVQRINGYEKEDFEEIKAEVKNS